MNRELDAQIVLCKQGVVGFESHRRHRCLPLYLMDLAKTTASDVIGRAMRAVLDVA